jgi:hypothetical protein
MDYDIYSAMQTKDPLARFQKTIVGKVYVTVLNEFNGQPEGVELQGTKEESYVEIWSDKGLAFFQRMNKDHLGAGRLKRLKKKPPKKAPNPNMLTDVEIDELLNSKGAFLKMKARANKFTEPAPAIALLHEAREQEKSDKVIAFLEEKIADLQLAEHEPIP